jgi:oxygen-dependent protoporphyrinogen oxidase
VFDSRQALSNAGAYGINDLNVVRYTFSGRAARDIGDATDAEALVARGEAALSRHLAIDRAIDRRWRRRFVARRFNPGLCAYTPYHSTFVDAVTRGARQLPGLYLTGDYMQGASIEACFRSASACAQQLAAREHLHSTPAACASRMVA